MDSENLAAPKKVNGLQISLLELVSYAPIAIILGNILPPIGFIKIHWVFIGLIFINTVLVLLKKKNTHGLFILIGLFACAQIIVSIKFSVVAFVDFISGPLLFIAMVNMMISDQVSIKTLSHYRKKALVIFAIPMVIAVLQYFKIVPLEFMNASYVNLTLYGSEILQRVNGFLYHGIELAVIIFFFFVSLTIHATGIRSYLMLSFMILFEVLTIIKTGIISALLYGGFYGYYIDQKLRPFKIAIITATVIFGFSFIYVLIPDLETDRISFEWSQFRFENQLFTGRGFIWNVYLQGATNFNILQVFFGGGFGSAPEVFKLGTFGENLPAGWSPGPHNQLLELFINGGLFAIWFIFHILQRQYRKISEYFQNNRATIQKYYLAILLIPLLVMGLTAPIMGMFIYWCGLSNVLISLKLKFDSEGDVTH